MKKFLLTFSVFFLAFLGASILFFPVLSRLFLTKIAVREAERLLQTDVEIASAEIRLLDLGVAIRGIKVYHPDRRKERVIEVRGLRIRIKPLPVFYGDLAGFELEMDHPRLVYATTKTGAWELTDRFPLLRRGKGESRLPVNIDAIVLNDGEVEYRDGKVGKTTTISDIDTKVTHVRLPSKQDPLPAKFKMNFDIEGGGDFELKGRADFLSPKISADATGELNDLPLPPYAPYYDHGLPVRIKRGTLDIASNMKCDKDYLKAPAHATIHGLEVEPKQAKIFGFASDRAMQALKDRKGNVELDLLITGNIRNPQFHIMNNLTETFIREFSIGMAQAISNGLGESLKDLGEGVKKEGKSGLDKLKGLFK